MKMFSLYPGCHEVQIALAEFFQILYKGIIWWCNILGYKKGRIYHTLRFDPITEGYILLTSNIFFSGKVNPEPILTVKITEMSKFIEYFGLIIEANPSRVVKKEPIFSVLDLK